MVSILRCIVREVRGRLPQAGGLLWPAGSPAEEGAAQRDAYQHDDTHVRNQTSKHFET